MITINGEEITAKEFAFDGCHKIYLINTKGDKAQYKEYGYNFFPIEDLKECYDNACGLKFISSADLKKKFVKQFEKAIIRGI